MLGQHFVTQLLPGGALGPTPELLLQHLLVLPGLGLVDEGEVLEIGGHRAIRPFGNLGEDNSAGGLSTLTFGGKNG